MSQYSDSHFSEDSNSSWYKVYSLIKPGSKILDIGCSSGNFGEVLINKKDCIVDGIELDDADYKIAKTKLRNVYKLNIETDDIKFIKDRYDYIYFGDVIEHLVYPSKSLEKVKSLLNSSGSVVFSIPNMSHISVRLMLLSGQFNYGKTGLLDDTHLHFYTHSLVQRVFTEAGYTITKLDPVLIDYPKDLIDQELAKLGLKSTKEFINFISTTEASVYQFVGSAAPTNTKSQKSKVLDKFKLYLDETRKYYEDLLKNNNAHIKKLEAKINESNTELANIKEKLNTLLIRRSIKMINKVIKPKVNGSNE